MVVVLYRIGMGMSRWWDLIIGFVWLCHDGEISLQDWYGYVTMVRSHYRIGMVMSRWWDLSICDVCYMLFLRGVYLWFAFSWGCSSSMSACCCPMCVSATVCPYPKSTAVGLLLWVVWRGEKPKNKSWCVLVCVGRWLVWRVLDIFFRYCVIDW